MRIQRIILAATLACLVSGEASAQTYPRRERGAIPGSPRDARNERPAAAPAVADPIAAIERELPSLKVDLRLTEEQAAAWNAFERDVRDVAEMGRARRRHVIAMANSTEAPTAQSLIGAVAEDDRLRAEAMAELNQHVRSLYAALGPDQRRLLDRRVAQSQTDPLGR